MKLISIEISNYRSIKNISIPVEKLTDGTSTYGLIGVNEAGKSSILKALALKDGLIALSKKDFGDAKKPILIAFKYELIDSSEREKLLAWIIDAGPIASASLSNNLTIEHSFDYESRTKSTVYAGTGSNGEDLRLPSDTAPPLLAHTSIFWTAEDKYLISHPISLASFASNPLKFDTSALIFHYPAVCG